MEYIMILIFFLNEEGKVLGGYENVSKVVKDGFIINNLNESIMQSPFIMIKILIIKFDTFFNSKGKIWIQ